MSFTVSRAVPAALLLPVTVTVLSVKVTSASVLLSSTADVTLISENDITAPILPVSV